MTNENKQKLKLGNFVKSLIRRLVFWIAEFILWPVYAVSVLICWVILFPSFVFILITLAVLFGVEDGERLTWDIFSHSNDDLWYDEGMFEDCSDPSHDGRFLSLTPIWGLFVHEILYEYFEKDL